MTSVSSNNYQKVLRYFDGSENWREKLYIDTSDPFNRRLVRRRQYILDMIQKVVGPEQGSVLDIGCGPGAYAEELAKRKFDTYGIDISTELLRVCQTRLKLNDADFDARFKHGRVENIPFARSFFDVAVCVGVLGYVGSEELALKEILRVLKPGGYLVLAVENVLSFSNIDYIAGLLARRLIRPRGQMPLDVLKRIGFESPWEFNHSGVSYKLYNPWRLEELMDDFGFTRLESMTVGHELRILRRSHIVPESVLTSIEVRLEKLFRGFPWRVLAYSGEFYVGLFRNDSDRKSHDGHREKIRNIDQTTPAREPVWARTREE